MDKDFLYRVGGEKIPAISWIAVRIALIYALSSVLYITFSDQIVHTFVQDLEVATLIQTLKGWGFVLLSALLIFVLLQREIRRFQEVQQRIVQDKLQFQTIIDNSTAIIHVKDVEGRFLLCNRQLEEFIGARPGELLGKTDAEILPGAQAGQSRKNDLQVLEYARPMEFEEIFEAGDGALRTYISLKFPLRRSDGKVYAVCGISTDITERKRTEEALRVNQERYRVLVENAPDAIVVYSEASGKFVDVNSNAERLFRMSRSALLECDPMMLSPAVQPNGAGSAALSRAMLAEALAGKTPAFDWVHRRSDGKEFTCEVRLVRIPPFEQRLVRGSIGDVTQRRKLEESFRVLLEIASRTAGNAFFETAAIEIARILAMDCVLIGRISPEDHERIESIAMVTQGALSDNVAYDLEDTPCADVFGKTPCIIPSGAAAQFPKDALLRDMGVEAYAGMPLFSSNGEPLGILVALSCVRLENAPLVQSVLQAFASSIGPELGRMQAEEALRKSEQNYREIFNSTTDAIFLYDMESGRLLDVNGATLEMFGLTRIEALSMTIAQLGRGDTGQSLEEAIRNRPGGAQAPFFEWLAHGKDAQPFWLEAALRNTEIGGAGCMLAVVRNITDRQKLEGQLRQAQKMEAIGQLAGGVAHDFNNILQAIVAHAGMVRMSVPQESPIHADLDEIESDAERASRLTRQLLTFSRNHENRPQVLDLAALVQNLARMLLRLLGHNISLELECPDTLPSVYADPAQMEQILVNLCVNARDAMPKGGLIGVKLSAVELDSAFCAENSWARAGRFLRLTVSDSGNGIPPENLERIFEPFFTTKGLDKGSGLGLATVYGIIQHHQGLLHVRSAPRQGSTFEVYIPLSGAAHETDARDEWVAAGLG
ncbi:MAG: PAS domain S-box protein [Candidatus Hydrogenedentes bacterium]|nr:PAS domain S-box protein [Candidatus Hydrogenedentota bacterium]